MKAKSVIRCLGILLMFSVILPPLVAQTQTDTIRFDVEPSSDSESDNNLRFQFSENVRDGIKIEWLSNNATETLTPDENGECTKEITAKAQVCIYYTHGQTDFLSVYVGSDISYADVSVVRGNNRITSLDLSGSVWMKLHCRDNQLASLDVSGCTALSSLDVSGNPLKRLNLSGCTSLTFLTCTGSIVTSMDISGCTSLTELSDVDADTLKIHGVSMEYLRLSCYQIKVLDARGCTSLASLDGSNGSCYDNHINSLDISGCTSLKGLKAVNADTLTIHGMSMDTLALNVGLSFFCHFNVLDASGCTSLKYLDCHFNALGILDMSGCTSLEYLDCSSNRLTSLDVSGCTSLEFLTCTSNRLTSLDVSGCTSLEYLNCISNQLTSLDVSGCTFLTELNFSDNQLTSLDVSGCTFLTELDFSDNQLTSLDVSGCTSLKRLIAVKADTLRVHGVSMDTLDLYLSGGYINVLEASGCTSLEYLDCHFMSLGSLDVSGCTSLMYLDCADNQLTSLDVSSCTSLENLVCSNNWLTNLNVRGCTALTSLDCGNSDWTVGRNRLSSLDVSTCTALTYLDCSNNRLLTELDVSACTALTGLFCGNNDLTSLDVSKNTALTKLDCGNIAGLGSNRLSSLDVSKNTALTSLNCSRNQLTDLDVSRNTALTELNCSYNRLHLPGLYNAYSRRSYKTFSAEGQWDTIVLPVGEELDLSSERRFGQSISTYRMTDQYGSEIHASDMWEEKGFVFRFNEPYTYWLEVVNVAIGDATFTWRISVTGELPADYFSIQTIANNTDWGTVTMTGNGRYREGMEVTVIATAKTGYRFVNWTKKDGSVFSTEAVYTFAVSGDLELTANFEEIPEEVASFSIVLSANNPEWGLVSQLGKGSYKEGEEATIIATANAGYRFVNWTKKDGSVFSTETVHIFAVTEDMELTANFEEQKPETYTVRLSVNNAEWGTATVSGNGTYEAGTEATITAKPKGNYRFINWTRKEGTVFSTDTVYRFKVTENLELTANFEEIPEEVESFTVNLSSNEPAWGLVSQLGTGTYDTAEEVTIIATPKQGYRFVNWTKKDGSVFSTEAVHTFTVTENLELTANFEKSGVGNESATQAGIRVYPNPNSGTFHIDLPEAALLEVFTSNGTLILREQAAAGIKTMQLESGSYLLHITSNGNTTTKRVVVL